MSFFRNLYDFGMWIEAILCLGVLTFCGGIVAFLFLT